jgi:hypothetical protein
MLYKLVVLSRCQHCKMSSSPATSESSRSTSPDTGATTPCSVLGGSSILSLPSIYVYFVGTSFTASTLEVTFKKHASDNCMGVIIDQNSVDRDNNSFSCKGEWMPLSLSHGNGGSTLNYFISTTVNLDSEDHAVPVGLIYHITCLPLPNPCLSTGHNLRIHESFTSKSRKYFLSLWTSFRIFSPLVNIFDPIRFRKISLCLSAPLVHYCQ